MNSKLKKWMKSFKEQNNISYNNDGSIDVFGEVDLYEIGISYLPFIFNVVHGNFYCFQNKLTSLKGFPRVVHGSVVVHSNMLTSLKYCPRVIDGYFNVSCNPLVDVEDIFRLKIGYSIVFDEDQRRRLHRISTYERLRDL